jgi:hypothetical protein
MCTARLLAMLLLLGGLAASLPAAGEPDGAPVGGEVVTSAEGPGATAETVIRGTRDSVKVRGVIKRKVVIHGDVVTKARGPRARACTSIGSLGRCADTARPVEVDVDLGEE